MGYDCQDIVGIWLCGGGSCSVDFDCPPVPITTTYELSGVVPVTDPAVVQCGPQGGSWVPINSTDANECLEQVETASSLDCDFRYGNGQVDASHGETCDDGNQTPGDGCDASCPIE